MRQLDDEFARNVAGIRDADVGDLTKSYGDYKLAFKNLLKRPQGGTPEEQLDVLRKKAELYKIINGSKQQRDIEEEIRKGLRTNPDIYEDEAHNNLFNSIRTPLSKMDDNMRNHDYSYKGEDYDMQKPNQIAAGTPRQVYQKEEPVGNEGLQFKITPYTYGNTPQQYKESLMGSLTVRKAGRTAAAIIAQTPQEVLDKIDQMYQAIPQERWQQMGIDKPQEMSIKDARTPQEAYAIHQSQLHALTELPKEGTPVFRDNKEAIEKRKEGFELKKLAIQHANAADLIEKRHDLTQGDAKLNDLWVDEYVDKKTEEAKPSAYREKGKDWEGTKEIALDPVLENAMKINGKPADFMKLMPNGEYRYGFYERDSKGALQKDKSGNHYAIDDGSVRTISKEGVKLALGKQAGVKQMNKEMSSGKQQTYKYKGNTITQTQLENAAKASGMTVEEYKKEIGL